MIEKTILLGSAASPAASLATEAEALPVLFTMKISDRSLDKMLGFSAGVTQATFGLDNSVYDNYAARPHFCVKISAGPIE